MDNREPTSVKVWLASDEPEYRDVTVSVVMDETTREEYKRNVWLDKETGNVSEDSDWQYSPDQGTEFDECEEDPPKAVVAAWVKHLDEAKHLAQHGASGADAS